MATTSGATSPPVDLSELEGVDLYGDGADSDEEGGNETLTYLACSEGNLAALKFVLEERTQVGLAKKPRLVVEI